MPSVEKKKPLRCPICGKPAGEEVRPFCSARCRDIDLARWLGGGYVIAGGDADADEEGGEHGLSGAEAAPEKKPE